ncbi:MAG: class SAM-dependent methyltransferase [Acidimicrobiales bacterium]|jgi:SAM-dependent methyltransferase|nr:class SAM-dependent methyltransferase [Acidimicrobiales bacterium]
MTSLETVVCAVCGSTTTQVARLRVPRDEFAVAIGVRGGRSRWVVCEQCGLVFQSPRPDAGAVDAMYLEGGYHEVRGGIPEHYVRYSLRRSQAAIAWGLEQPGLRGRMGRALDIGSGIGGALVCLRERGWDVTGVEPDPNLAAAGRLRFGLRLVQGFLDDSVLEGEAFDLAYSCHVWEHLADPRATSAVAHKLLAAQSGYLLIVVPTFRKARTWAWSCFTAPHTYMFTDVSLSNLLASAGFKTISYRYASAADSELWLLAQAVEPVFSAAAPRREVVGSIQREIATVPLRAPLGLPNRALAHIRTLAADPRDFWRRLTRWTRSRSARIRVTVTGRRR